MNDLISRSAAIEAFEMRKSTFESMPSSVSNMIINAIVMCKTVVETAPAIEALPVVHAKWIKHYIKIGNFDWKYKCSMCGKFNKQYSPPYCPHCGARMDGESDD